jgi:hypothetical protein
LKSRLLMRTQIVACASPAYTARHGMPRRPGDVEKHQCVLMRNPATGSHFEWAFVRGKKTVPVNVSGQLMVNGVGPMFAACVGGQGFAQFFELYTRDILAAGRLVQVLPDWAEETYPLYAYHRSAQLMSAKVRAFLDFEVGGTYPGAVDDAAESALPAQPIDRLGADAQASRHLSGGEQAIRTVAKGTEVSGRRSGGDRSRSGRAPDGGAARACTWR